MAKNNSYHHRMDLKDQICNGTTPGSQFLELMAVGDSATHLKQFVVL